MENFTERQAINVLVEKIHEKGSAAWETEISVMLNLKMATSREDAIAKIDEKVNSDPAKIAEKVLFAFDRDEEIIGETNLSKLASKSADSIIKMLEEAHIYWVIKNVMPKQLAEKFANDELYQYNSIRNTSWEFVQKEYLFIESYIAKSGNNVSKNELKEAFLTLSKKSSEGFDETVAELFKRRCELEIVWELEDLRTRLDQEKDAEEIAKINRLLYNQYHDGAAIINQMILAKNMASTKYSKNK